MSVAGFFAGYVICILRGCFPLPCLTCRVSLTILDAPIILYPDAGFDIDGQIIAMQQKKFFPKVEKATAKNQKGLWRPKNSRAAGFSLDSSREREGVLKSFLPHFAVDELK
jgi:hypothetical protein